jgi:hypothetical protein
MTDALIIADGPENTGYRFSWGLAIAGGVIATAVTFFLLSLGAGFGLLLVNPVTHTGPSVPTFLTGGAIYFMAAQAFGFAVGGHLAGRLLGPLVETQIQEDFRAVAHGLVAWAVAVLATLTMVAFTGMAATSTGATVAALYGASATKTADASPSSYLADVLFRPDPGTAASATANVEAKAEAVRILDAGLARGEQLDASDRTRLGVLVASQAGIAPDAALQRIDAMQTSVQAKTAEALNVARKTASYTSLWIAFSLLFGAIVAMVAAMLARLEDDRDSVGVPQAGMARRESIATA